MAQPTVEKHRLSRQMSDEMENLRTLRDQIRVDLHLASMDVRSAWNKLEKRFELLEERFGREGDHVARATRQLAKELERAFADFKRRLV